MKEKYIYWKIQDQDTILFWLVLSPTITTKLGDKSVDLIW